MDSNNVIEIIQQVGIGGGIAVFMFMLYRKDARAWADSIIKQNENWREVSSHLLAVVKENTSSITRLSTVVDALHRRLDRDD